MIRRVLACAAVLGVLAACDTTEPRVPTSIEVDVQTLELEVGETSSVQARVLDQHGRAYDTPPEGFGINWTTSNSSVASVTGGQITGAGPGAATITASAGGLPPAQIQVTVQATLLDARISFDYSGDRSGTFDLDTEFTLDAFGGDWAVTFHAIDNGDQFTDVMAQRQRGDGRVDFLWFWVSGHITTPGTRAGEAVLILGWDLATDAFENFYVPVSGTVNHTSVTSARMAGTFTFVLEEADTEAALTISNGSFDLPRVNEQDLFGSPAAFEGMASHALPEALLELRRAVQRGQR